MKLKWDVDENTVVEAHLGFWGRKRILVNGAEVYRQWKLGASLTALFLLPDGRQGLFTTRKRFVGAPLYELSVGGSAVALTGSAPIHCPACHAPARSFDKFCPACGKAMPSESTREHGREVGAATSTIKWLAVLYLVFGGIMYFVVEAQLADTMRQLQGMDPAEVLKPIDGVTYTVAEFRSLLEQEPRNVLIINWVLAAAMAVLAFWSRRAPLAASIIALATFVVVNVANAMLDPASLGKGVIVKIIVVVMLTRGINAALALRTAQARDRAR